MTEDRWHLDPDDVLAVRSWLRDVVAASPAGSWHRTPRLRDVLCTHVEDGFVHLTFLDRPLAAARAVADQLLHPDALLVGGSGADFTGTSAPTFEGFGWTDEPPDAVVARYPSRPPLQPTSTALPLPGVASPAGPTLGSGPTT